MDGQSAINGQREQMGKMLGGWRAHFGTENARVLSIGIDTQHAQVALCGQRASLRSEIDAADQALPCVQGGEALADCGNAGGGEHDGQGVRR